MERFLPVVTYEDTGPDTPLVSGVAMQPAPDGEYCRAEIAERLAGLLRDVLDFAPPLSAASFRTRKQYETATDAAYALLEELGR